MPQYNIRKGTHKSRVWPRIFFRKKKMVQLVSFAWSCKYELPVEQQLDWNKLFGMGWLPGHHHSSARFAWRWNPDINRIQLAAYVYNQGQRSVSFLCNIAPGFGYKMELLLQNGEALFIVTQANCDFEAARVTLPLAINGNWSYMLFPYFGGTSLAPHDLSIYMTHV